jgi:hypothetical protein
LRKMEVVALILFLGLSSAVFADQITLKNGDRLTGTVVKSDGKVLVLHTEFAGDVTLQFAAITQITTEKELHVSTSDKQTVVGPVTSSDGKLEVATKSGGTIEVPVGKVVLIRNDAEQAAYDKSLHPGLTHGWNGGADVGFSLARGNSETENLALALNAAHPTLNDKIILHVSSIYTDTKNPQAIPSTTVVNLIQAGIRYDRNIDPRLFGFGAADFTSNAQQYLDLRAVYAGGLGYHAVKSAGTTLDFLAGGNYTHETYSNGPPVPPPPPPAPPPPTTYTSYGVTNRFAALTLGEDLTHKMGKSTAITQNLYLFPDLSDTGEYRATFNFGSVTKVSKWLGWQNQFGDIYVSNPPATAKKNDVIFTTGLNFSFTH